MFRGRAGQEKNAFMLGGMDTLLRNSYRRERHRGKTMRQDTFGWRLKRLRMDLGMRQEDVRAELARLTGTTVGATYISDLERTDKMPTLAMAAAMAKILGTTVDYLALLTDDPQPVQHVQEYITPEADELARLADALPAEARAELLAVARRLARPGTGRAEREREVMWWLTRVEAAAGLAARQALERAIMNGEFASND